MSTKQEVEKLMKRIRSADQDYKPPGQWTMEGFLYIQEKRESFHSPRPHLCNLTDTTSLISAWFYIHHHKRVLSSPWPRQKRSSHRALTIHPVYYFDALSYWGRWGGRKW